MTRRSPLGLVTKAEKEPLKVDVLKTRKAELDALTERIRREAPDMTFDLGAVVDDALRVRIREANRELDARGGRTRP